MLINNKTLTIFHLHNIIEMWQKNNNQFIKICPLVYRYKGMCREKYKICKGGEFLKQREDRRVRYTRMVLRESLVRLLAQKTVAQVSVTELCEMADINRATFYAHYSDPQDLLRSIESELIDDINTFLATFSFDGGDAPVGLLQQVFSYIKENHQVCAVLLADNGDIAFQRKVAGIVSAQCIKRLTDERRADARAAEYIYLYASTGSVGLIQRWLADGMRETPAEMAALVSALVSRGMSAFYEKQP